MTENNELNEDSMHQIPETPQNTGWDNEWVKFMAKLSENEATWDIAEYIKTVHWSRRQKETLRAYCNVVLGSRFSTTNITDGRDYMMLYDDKVLIDNTLPIGLTRFDLTPEWNTVLTMVNLHFGASSRMSKAGWFVKKIGTHRTEIDHEERTRDRTRGFKEKIESKLFGE